MWCLTGLLLCLGGCQLIISSRGTGSFDLLLFVVKLGKKGKKLSPKDPRPLDLTKKSICKNLTPM